MVSFSRNWRVILFYGRALPMFMRCFFSRDLTLSFGRHYRFGGEVIPFFFRAENLPLAKISTNGHQIEKSYSYQRAKAAVDSYPIRPHQQNLGGRSTQRIWKLVDARMKGHDSFEILVVPRKKGGYRLVDGETRASIVAATGGKTITARVTVRA